MIEKEPMAEVRLELELGGIHAYRTRAAPVAPAARERGAPAPSRTTAPGRGRVRGGGVSPDRATDGRTGVPPEHAAASSRA